MVCRRFKSVRNIVELPLPGCDYILALAYIEWYWLRHAHCESLVWCKQGPAVL